MRPIDLKLRCYVQQEPDYSWFAVCIDLNLVAQGDTLEEARHKLHAIIGDFLLEAFTKDEQYFNDLVPRKAPIAFLLRYYWLSLLAKLSKTIRHTATPHLFTEHLPLIPMQHGR